MAAVPFAHDRAGLDHDVVIVGSGFSGIGAAVELQRRGFQDYVILEKADAIGGTWRDASYPGLEVDMPSFIYSYPFALSADWDHVYPRGAQILDYTRATAARFGVDARVRTDCAVRRSTWDDAAGCWTTELESGERIRSRFLVSASGLLVDPQLPSIEGIETFSGPVVHTGRWDHDLPLEGKRVAVIGTGASAIQLVPSIVDDVAALSVFQRTPIWLMSKPDAAISPRTKRLFARWPFLQRLARWAVFAIVELTLGPGFVHYRKFPFLIERLERSLIEWMRTQVDDPALQEALIPRYSFFCKRPSFSNTYYACFNREHVELVTASIDRIEPDGIRTVDGRRHAFDVLVCATGYSVFDPSCMPNFEIVGRTGRALGEFWAEERYRAYEGATVPGYPNLFLFMGPYSAAGASYFTMIDTQSRHMSRVLVEARRRGASRIEVRKDAFDADFARVERRREDTLLFAGDCAASNSYYFDAHGDTPGLRPVTGGQHWLRSRTFPLSDYHFDTGPPGTIAGERAV
ncbi:MAG: NAD(P)/FAD-dependent oxidoreductase [Myxococcota bacterium]